MTTVSNRGLLSSDIVQLCPPKRWYSNIRGCIQKFPD